MPNNNKSVNKKLSLTRQLLIIGLAIAIAAAIFQSFDYALDYMVKASHPFKHIIETTVILTVAEITAYFVLKKQQTLYEQATEEIDRRKEAQQKLKETIDRFKILFEYSPDAYLIINSENKIIDSNTAAQKITGFSKEEINNKNYALLFPEYQQKKIAGNLLAGTRGYGAGPEELILINKDGNGTDIEVRTFPIKIKNQSVILATAHEITNRKKIAKVLKQTERKYRLLVENLPDALRVSDSQGVISYISSNIQKIYGFSQQEIYNAGIEQIWLSRIHPEDKEKVKHAFRQLFLGQSYDIEYRIRKKDDSWIWVRDIAELVQEDSRNFAYAVFSDITKRKKMEQKIKHLAFYDTITNLPNRQLLKTHFDQSLAFAKRSNSILAVLYLDLDKFKSVNDTLGHDAGDVLLKEVSNRLAQEVRETDTVARVGGDEFVIVLAMIKEKQDAAALAQTFLDSIAKPFLIEGKKINITASIGISIFPDNGDNLQNLTTKADDAMRVVKAQTKNGFNFFYSTIV